MQACAWFSVPNAIRRCMSVRPSILMNVCGAAPFSTTSARHDMKNRTSRHRAEDHVNPLERPSNIDKAALHVVSVPIGNLKDFTLRALDVLRNVDYIISTDRQATKTLMELVDIDAQGRIIQYNAAQTSAAEKLLEMLRGGRSMALVTASGTPCVGDAGSEVVQYMLSSGVRVTAVPGASAIMAALSVVGIPTTNNNKNKNNDDTDGDSTSSTIGSGPINLKDIAVIRDGSFFFGNMLPDSTGARLRYLRRTVATADHPCVFYEVPRRLITVLQDIAAIMPRRRIVITHELTKLNESVHADTAERLVAFYMQSESQVMLKKGQLVLIIEPAGRADLQEWVEAQQIKRRRHRAKIEHLMSKKSAASTTKSKSKSQISTSSVSGEPKESRRQKKILLSRSATTTTGSTTTTSTSSSSSPLLKKRKALASKLKEKKRLKREKRDRMIQQIEMEQEKLRLAMEINRNDARQL